MTQYLLDTDTASYIIRRRPAEAARRFGRLRFGQLCVSVITEAELHYGLARLPDARRLRPEVEDFLGRLEVLDWARLAALHYAELRAWLERKGTRIGSLDLMIAAQARSIGAVLVTNNERHFRRVPDLKVENWLQG